MCQCMDMSIYCIYVDYVIQLSTKSVLASIELYKHFLFHQDCFPSNVYCSDKYFGVFY